MSKGVGATDAGASTFRATVGGWWSDEATPIKSEVRWFSVEVTSQNCPWAWTTGNPQHKIGALELFDNWLLLTMLSESVQGQHVCWKIKSHTDNQANTYGMHRWSLRGVPQCFILMEIALLAQRRNIFPAVDHVPRHNNQWADQLTHADSSGFSPMRRWSPTEPF
eukprot:6472873-Amphidinium_carterae.1